MKIAVDAMGGDLAPEAIVRGALRAAEEDGTSILLVGDEAAIAAEMSRFQVKNPNVEVVHSDEVVGMDEPAITPLRKKRRSSVRICGELVKAGKAHAMVTAGNTGAAMITAKVIIGAIEGVDRPSLAAVFPSRGGRTVVLDVGANVDTRPSHLRQFAVMGHFYAQEILGIVAPKVGLLSIGTEANKGSDLTKEVFKVMQTTGLNFVGNVEGRDVFNGTLDVVVCDGFVGNVLLKSAESFAKFMEEMMVEELKRSWRSRIGAYLAKPAFRHFLKRIDYTEYGAAPLLGINGGCFIGHGSSNSKAIQNAIRRAVEFSVAQVHTKIRDKVAELHAQEKRLLHEANRVEVSVS